MLSVRYRLFAATCTVLVSSFFLLAAAAISDEFEEPPTFSPQTLLSQISAPPGVEVADPITSDGLFRIYQVTTPFGEYVFEGDAYLKMRLAELAATEKLAKVELSDTFKASLEQAVKAPVGFVQGAVEDPGRAVQKTLTGVSRLFDRAASGLRNIGKSEDGMAESLLGVSKAKREIAISLGVDPYTDFEPLRERLDKAAKASAAGGLTVKGLLALVPGGVGLAASSVSTASELTTLVRDKTSSELLEINRGKLVRAVGNKPSVNAFLENPNFTPTDQTILAKALFKLRDTKNVDAFLTRIAAAEGRSQAVFLRQRAVMHAQFSEGDSPIEQFIVTGGVPIAADKEGKTVALFPIDALAWTERTASIIDGVAQEIKASRPDQPIELTISGEATELANSKISALGWTIKTKFEVRRPQ